MNRQKRLELKNQMAKYLVENGINEANNPEAKVDPNVVMVDSFFTEYIELQTALQRVLGLVKYSVGPTRDVKTPHLQEAIHILTELIDAPEEKEVVNV